MSKSNPAGPSITFEQSLELQEIKEDTFQDLHRPWTWHASTVVPGGLLISVCACAAYKTMSSPSFTLDNVQAQFLAKTDPELPITYSVKRLSSGKRFAVRTVTASQSQRGGKEVIVLVATIAFASHPAVDNQPAMTYSVERETSWTIDEITLDDLENARSSYGPFMKFQRLGVYDSSTSSSSSKPDQTSRTTCHAARLTSPLQHLPGHNSHILALLNLSDYHVLDCPLTLSNLTFGLFATNDHTRTELPMQAKMYTSLNHAVYIHRWDGWRADELVYIEGKSSWAGDGRAYVTTRMFDKGGRLIASCVQEAFYMLNDDVQLGSKSKL